MKTCELKMKKRKQISLPFYFCTVCYMHFFFQLFSYFFKRTFLLPIYLKWVANERKQFEGIHSSMVDLKIVPVFFFFLLQVSNPKTTSKVHFFFLFLLFNYI